MQTQCNIMYYPSGSNMAFPSSDPQQWPCVSAHVTDGASVRNAIITQDTSILPDTALYAMSDGRWRPLADNAVVPADEIQVMVTAKATVPSVLSNPELEVLMDRAVTKAADAAATKAADAAVAKALQSKPGTRHVCGALQRKHVYGTLGAWCLHYFGNHD